MQVLRIYHLHVQLYRLQAWKHSHREERDDESASNGQKSLRTILQFHFVCSKSVMLCYVMFVLLCQQADWYNNSAVNKYPVDTQFISQLGYQISQDFPSFSAICLDSNFKLATTTSFLILTCYNS